MTPETSNHSVAAPALHEATILRQTDYAGGYFVMELACPELASAIDVGQFVNVRVDTGVRAFLRRPFSVFDVLTDARGEGKAMTLLYHTVGPGTRALATLGEGARLSLNGPLGLPFPAPEDPDAAVIMVGGGIGLAPFLLQARRFMRREPKRDYALFAGGRSERDLRYLKLFAPLLEKGLHLMISTDDGSTGIKGLVTLPLRGELESRRKAGKPATVYCCGPTPMMKAVAKLCMELDFPCLVSLENHMACGYGVCNGCVVPLREMGAATGVRYAKTCSEGPAFDASTILWDARP